MSWQPTHPEDVNVAQHISHISINDSQQVTFNQTQIIQISASEVKTRPFRVTSPYKGLKQFESDDRDRFFGRYQFLAQLVEEFNHTNMMLLLGASGSGKSSLVRAGLIPCLQNMVGGRFIHLLFTPDHDPFESLYASLLCYFKQADAALARNHSSDTLSQVVARLKHPDEYWLIAIDQLEELFTTSSSEWRDRFIASLVQLAQTQDPSITIVATLRADFLDKLSPYPTLVNVTDNYRPMMADMHPDELRLAIEQPAAQQGVVFEVGLVEEIIHDIQGQAGYLPLLQYTLNLLWETASQTADFRDHRTLQRHTYQRLGGVRGALQNHVDQIYHSLSADHQLATQRIFLKLVGIGGDEASGIAWKPVRRRTPRTDFSDALESQVLTRLIDEKLLVSDQQPQSPVATIELAHEILLTSWPTLNTWIQENRQAIACRNRLNDDVARWRSRPSDDELWSGSKLEQVLELQTDHTFNHLLGGFSDTAMQFINASVSLRDRMRQRELQQERAKTRWAMAAAGMAIATLIAGGMAWEQTQHQRSLEITQDVLLGTARPELIKTLPGLLKHADQMYETGETQRSLALYRNVWLFTKRLQQSPSLNQHPEVAAVAKQAEAGLVSVIHTEYLPQLETQLRNKMIGEQLADARLPDYEEQYKAGALRTTYSILMRDAGAKADLNDNGRIDNLEEAKQMPCKTLQEIEQLWRQLTNNRCGWYEPDSAYRAPNCQELQGATLTTLIFARPYNSAIEQLNACHVAQTPADPDSL